MYVYVYRWVFLVYDHEEKDLDMVVTNGQDTPATNPKTTPILLLDVWEHSYYLDVRPRARHFFCVFAEARGV